MPKLKLADKLLKTRIEKKFSKQEVADRLNMDITTYGRVERGERYLEFDKLKLLDEVLDIDSLEILQILELDKTLILNITNAKNPNTTDEVNLQEIKELYNNLISQKDYLIMQLQEEIKRLRAQVDIKN